MHPLDKFLFCPVCGSKAFGIHNFKSKQCAHCGFTYYANPCSATAAFIVDDTERLLVARRGKEPAKGTLDLPGGFVDMGETAEEGMRREIMEETGIAAGEVRYLFSIPNDYVYSDMTIYTLDMFFEVHVNHDVKIEAADDAAALQWLPLSQVNPDLFGLHSIRQGVIRYLSKRQEQ